MSIDATRPPGGPGQGPLPEAPAGVTATEAAPAPGGSRHLGLALVVISMAQLMLVLDELIVNTALPHIQHALGFSGTGLEWIVTRYAITFGGLAYLPFIGAFVVVAGISSKAVSRVGARPLMTLGAIVAPIGLFWLSRVHEGSHYFTGVAWLARRDGGPASHLRAGRR